MLSRFAYMRRRGVDMVLESPRAGAIFRLCDAGVAAMIAALAEPRTVAQLRREPGFPGVELLALLVDCQILFAPGPDAGKGLRASEGDDDLVLWDFHDLLFHVRSTNGRHANPTGGLYAHAHLAPAAGRAAALAGPAIELSGPRSASQLRHLRRCCAGAIRRATSTIGVRSPLPKWRGFSTGRRVSFRGGACMIRT